MHEVILGDCLTEGRELEDESYDGIIADPPYGISFDSGTRRKVLESFGVIQNDTAPFIWWLWDAARILRTGGHLICFCRWDVAEAFRLAIGWAGLTVKSQAIWDRGNHGLGDLKGQFAPMHDIIWHATKGKGELYGKRPVSVISSMRLSGQQLNHPNEKPVPLLRYLVRAITKPGDSIYDPFAGVGSVGKACQLERRNYLGIEIEPKYAKYAQERLARMEHTLDLDVEEDTAPSSPIQIGLDLDDSPNEAVYSPTIASAAQTEAQPKGAQNEELPEIGLHARPAVVDNSLLAWGDGNYDNGAEVPDDTDDTDAQYDDALRRAEMAVDGLLVE